MTPVMPARPSGHDLIHVARWMPRSNPAIYGARMQYHEPAGPRAVRPPWAGVIVSTAGFLAMIAIAWALWDSLPEHIVTREATDTRAGATVPRLVMAGALPAGLLIVAALTPVGLIVQRRLARHFPPLLIAPPHAQARALNVLFVVLPLLLVTLQAVALAKEAGYDIPVERVMGVALGIVLIILGRALPAMGSSDAVPDGSIGRLIVAWQRSHREGGLALTALGAACAAGSLFLPPLLVGVASALLVGAVFALMAVLAVVRTR
jgi:hypothetical protein